MLLIISWKKQRAFFFVFFKTKKKPTYCAAIYPLLYMPFSSRFSWTIWSNYTSDISLSPESGIRKYSPHWPCAGMHMLEIQSDNCLGSLYSPRSRKGTSFYSVPSLGSSPGTSSTYTADLGYLAEICKAKYKRYGSKLQWKLLLLLKINSA